MTAETDRDFERLNTLAVPVKRAAYSDRSAWTMAVLAEIAYTPLDEESEHQLVALAGELAALTNQEQIVERLRELRKSLSDHNEDTDEARNEKLRAALKVGGFELAGDRPLHDAATDTQGFVACKPQDERGVGMAVICFRGTKQVKDWMTNVKIESVPIKDPRPDHDEIIGNMHRGFHDAYMSVHDAIGARLEGHEKLPLYITGHSLGGALAVVATWYQSSERLAACYTFGAPRVGDQGLIDRFKTPIYRIVNGPDPVPFVPPSGGTITFLKAVFRVVGGLLPFFDVMDWLVNKLIRIQHFRHYGYMRYLSVAEPGPKGDYPKLQLEFSLSSTQRLSRFVRLYSADRAKRLDKYHNMSLYRDKLRAQAIKRNA